MPSSPCSRSATTQGDYGKALLFHGLTQQRSPCALVGGSAGVVGVGAVRHLVVATGHHDLFAGLQVVEREVDGAAAIVFGACCRVGNEDLLSGLAWRPRRSS